jgi:hypothetical protein
VLGLVEFFERFLGKVLCLVFLRFERVEFVLAFEVVSVQFQVALSCLRKSVTGLSVKSFLIVFPVIILVFIIIEAITFEQVLFRQVIVLIIVLKG